VCGATMLKGPRAGPHVEQVVKQGLERKQLGEELAWGRSVTSGRADARAEGGGLLVVRRPGRREAGKKRVRASERSSAQGAERAKLVEQRWRARKEWMWWDAR